MTDFLLVHGAWHGGWCWNELSDRLRAKGHRVVAPTLTGLGERSHLMGPDVGLGTHIADVVNAADWEELNQFVLVGHSYGGIVVSGATERLRGRIAGLVYIDAVYAEDGQSCSDISGNVPERGSALPVPPVAIFGIADPSHAERVARLMTPHPANTLLDRVTLTGALEPILTKAYILAELRNNPLFAKSHDMLSADPSWSTFKIATGHHPMLDAPDELAELLLKIVR